MAIKIKNKGKDRPEEPPEEEGGSGVPPGGAPGSNLDGFERASFMAAVWIEDNRGLFFAMVGLTLVAVLGVVLGIYYVRGQQLEASDRLSEGLAAYEVPVEGSPDLDAIRQHPDIPEPPHVYDTKEEKWEAVYASAASTLEDFDGGPIAVSARLVKAAAALNLEKYEESATLYQQVIDLDRVSTEFRANAYMGLANSLAAQQDLEGAKQAWEGFSEVLPERKAYADFEMARMTERYGEPDDARERYERFVDEHPDSTHVEEVERRQALL